MRHLSIPLVFVLLVAFTGCIIHEPEGPAEQIGKGVDMITGGLQQYDKDARANSTDNNFDRSASDQFGRYDDTYGKDSYRKNEDFARPTDDFNSRYDQTASPELRPTPYPTPPSDDAARDNRRY